jgi:hypothetical protein
MRMACRATRWPTGRDSDGYFDLRFLLLTDKRGEQVYQTNHLVMLVARLRVKQERRDEFDDYHHKRNE